MKHFSVMLAVFKRKGGEGGVYKDYYTWKPKWFQRTT